MREFHRVIPPLRAVACGQGGRIEVAFISCIAFAAIERIFLLLKLENRR